jgi:4'-phosphopantetheinyl transferase
VIGSQLSGAIRRLPQTPFGAEFWLVDLSERPCATELSTLCAAEHDAAARFVFDVHRRRYQAAHVALRHLLADTLDVAPDSLEFLTGAHGKPALQAGFDCSFNMSHCEDWGLIGVRRGMGGIELGVDIEIVREVRDAAELAQRHFTASEQRELAECAADARDKLFLCGWTRKEACLKAVGSGLSIAPSTFGCGISPGFARTCIPTSVDGASVDVEVDSLDVGGGRVAAVAMMRVQSVAP